MSAVVTLAVVLACHNRRETTLRCLAGLFAQQSPAIRLAVHLLDDGSTDGTAAAVAQAFPQVTLVAGDGSLFWGGGMHAAMRSAGTEGYDAMLWLNDDVTLRPDTLHLLLGAWDEARSIGDARGEIIVGACVDPATGRVRYGGLRRRSRWHPSQLDLVPPDPDRLTRCDAMHGNVVLVPVAVVRRIGFVDPAFVHQSGDIDYGYRAARAGVGLWLAREPVGACGYEVRPQPWLNPALGLRARWRVIDTPLGYPLKPWVRFMWRHGGLPAVLALGVTYARVLFPRLMSRRTPR